MTRNAHFSRLSSRVQVVIIIYRQSAPDRLGQRTGTSGFESVTLHPCCTLVLGIKANTHYTNSIFYSRVINHIRCDLHWRSSLLEIRARCERLGYHKNARAEDTHGYYTKWKYGNLLAFSILKIGLLPVYRTRVQSVPRSNNSAVRI